MVAFDSSRAREGPAGMLSPMADSELTRAIAVAAFVASYIGLGLGRVPGLRVDRTGVAIIGAAVMVVSGAVPWADAVAAVDAPTLVLLFGMMIVTAYLRLSGFFSLVMTWALRRARTPRMLLAVVVVASGVLSALFVNDVLAMASTLAGNLTLLGSVANLIVVETARAARVEIGFVEYCKVGVPLTLVTLLFGWLLLALVPV